MLHQGWPGLSQVVSEVIQPFHLHHPFPASPARWRRAASIWILLAQPPWDLLPPTASAHCTGGLPSLRPGFNLAAFFTLRNRNNRSSGEGPFWRKNQTLLARTKSRYDGWLRLRCARRTARQPAALEPLDRCGHDADRLGAVLAESLGLGRPGGQQPAIQVRQRDGNFRQFLLHGLPMRMASCRYVGGC